MKDLYIAELERIAAELQDAGVPADKAYDLAADRAYSAMRETLADRADAERMRRKENS